MGTSLGKSCDDRGMMKTVAICGALLLGLAACQSSRPSASKPSVSASSAPVAKLALQKLGDFDSPVWAGVAPGDDRIFVVEKTGRIRIVGQQAAFLDISTKGSSGKEQGLLSMAFANDWST